MYINIVLYKYNIVLILYLNTILFNNIGGKNMESISYEDLNYEFLENNNHNQICIHKGDYKFYFKLHLKMNNKKVVVFSNGTINHQKSTPPVFMRSTWNEEINASCIYTDDPTIHETRLTIGWGIGRKDTHFLEEISTIIKKITDCLNVEDKNTLYYGSSAGGMMSMMLSIYHTSTKVVVNNPQMFVYNYLDGKPLSFLRQKFFKEYSQPEFIKKYITRLSVPHFMKVKNYIPQTLFILNKKSVQDFDKQYLPFIEFMRTEDVDESAIQYLIYTDKHSGHNPLNKTKTINIINSSLKGEFF